MIMKLSSTMFSRFLQHLEGSDSFGTLKLHPATKATAKVNPSWRAMLPLQKIWPHATWVSRAMTLEIREGRGVGPNKDTGKSEKMVEVAGYKRCG